MFLDPFPGEPGESEKGQIERVLLVNKAEIIPKIAESKKKTNPLALITPSIFIQNRFDVHGALLGSKQPGSNSLAFLIFSATCCRGVEKSPHGVLSTQYSTGKAP